VAEDPEPTTFDAVQNEAQDERVKEQPDLALERELFGGLLRRRPT